MKRALLAALLALSVAVPAWGREAPPSADDPGTEARMRKLTEELRCLVCQNQTLADSHAELANDLKEEVREQIRAGKSDKEIVDYLVSRYGDFVLYRPPVKASTVVLWVGPFLLMLAGGAALVLYLRKRATKVEEASLSDEERRRAAELLSPPGG